MKTVIFKTSINLSCWLISCHWRLWTSTSNISKSWHTYWNSKLFNFFYVKFLIFFRFTIVLLPANNPIRMFKVTIRFNHEWPKCICFCIDNGSNVDEHNTNRRQFHASIMNLIGFYLIGLTIGLSLLLKSSLKVYGIPN